MTFEPSRKPKFKQCFNDQTGYIIEYSWSPKDMKSWTANGSEIRENLEPENAVEMDLTTLRQPTFVSTKVKSAFKQYALVVTPHPLLPDSWTVVACLYAACQSCF